ncbi:MAG TPA: hypothetical protein VFO29_05360 [Candidatus Rubrimentiphilum sp.]|nr:hypothetical protein [Candidatus Rubrimentiphilum sp.]
MSTLAMPIKPINVTLWDVPSTNQVRGTISLQGLPKGVSVQISLKAAGPGPDAALIGTGTCTSYKKLYALKPAKNGLSYTTIPSADMVKLFKTPHVVVMPGLKYCGALKSPFLH